jgi:hypothetical protein
VYEDSLEEEQYEELRQALPKIKIMLGACLGSGWLLLIIPIITFGIVGRKILKKKLSR